MVDFQKLCDEYENLTFPQLVKDLADKSIKVFSRLSAMDIDLAANRNLEDNELQMLRLLSLVDDDVRRDIIAICIMVINVDGKIPSEEKQYIKKLA